jgi:hypothetical protein
MRPGATGLGKVVLAANALYLSFLGFTVWIEMGMIGAGDPISWYMADAPRMLVALLALFAGLWFGVNFGVVLMLLAHFYWPARAGWKRVWTAVKDFGDPAEAKLRYVGSPGIWLSHLETYAKRLWRLS